MVCVVGWMRDLILQLSKSSIYSTKPSETDAYCEGLLTEVWDQVVVARNYRTPDAFFQYWSEDMDHYVEMDELYRCSFQSFWDQIYGSGSWVSNPLVWVVTFKLLDFDKGGE